MTGWIFAVGAVLVAVAGIGYRRRLGNLEGNGLSESAIRQIEASGRMETDDPLDLGEAAEEEERFWGESWDEPEPLQ